MKFFAFSFLAALVATVSGFACTDSDYPYAACCESFSDELPNYCIDRIRATNFVVNHFGPEPLFTCRDATHSVGACCDKDDGLDTGCLPFAVADENDSSAK